MQKFQNKINLQKWEDKKIPKATDLVVNCTSIGMKANEKLELDFSVVKKGIFIYDIVYKKGKTFLLRRSTKLGHRTSDGLSMLIRQAAESFHYWFNIYPTEKQIESAKKIVKKDMIVIVITGQVATGKSTLAKIIKCQKYRVFDADECAHKLLINKAVKEEIKKCFKSKEKFIFDKNGKIDKSNLGAYVFANTKRLEKLELILHPKIREKQKLFLKHCSINKNKVVFLDIPLF